MTDGEGERDDMAGRLVAALPRLMHALRRDRMQLTEHDPLASILSERRGQFRLLHTLLNHDALTTQELAQRLNVAPPTISTMVHALAEQELVTRERDATDQRQVRISLSERGRRAVEEEHERMGRLMDARIALLDPSDQEAITRALPALERLLGTESHPCQRKDS